MPHSYGYFKEEIKEHFLLNVDVKDKILDVGPGCGTYSLLLSPPYQNMDAVEIFPEYIERFHLHSLYQNVYVADVSEFDFSSYNYLIFGDVLEHMTVQESQRILKLINDNGQKCMVAVPYLFEQKASEGNSHEAHLQPDLTHDIFLERYPYMFEIYRNEYYGYYCNYHFEKSAVEINSIKNQVANILRRQNI